MKKLRPRKHAVAEVMEKALVPLTLKIDAMLQSGRLTYAAADELKLAIAELTQPPTSSAPSRLILRGEPVETAPIRKIDFRDIKKGDER
ncbi:MAG: hypothetical protein ING69_10495 [Rhodocyclaceae bacterium]|nr:hypothetical protein [Rhodocyclaceae bacterium]